MTDLLIRRATLALTMDDGPGPCGHEVAECDVLVRGGAIAAVGPGLRAPGAEVVEAEAGPLVRAAEVEAVSSVATRVHSIYTVAYLLRRPCGLLHSYLHPLLRYQRCSPPSSSQLPMRPVPRLPPASTPLPRFLPL